ncbi:MAG: hypothetical protein MUP70_17220, partial [Candidatus Aminicenantes bacterium]|nr:hypothetical protein [Candidatus Aminicenantes bacterium]
MIKKILFALIALSILVFTAASCGLFSSAKIDVHNKGLVHLMDVFGQKNLIRTPFENLISHFQSFEEILDADHAVLIPELSTSLEKTFAVTTERPILEIDETKKPEEMEILLGDTTVEYLEKQGTGDLRWQLVKTGKEIDISFDEKYNREYQLLILDQDESFVFNNFFPDAPVVLEVRVRRDNQPQN